MLKNKIESILNESSIKTLVKNQKQLSTIYRQRKGKEKIESLSTEAQHLSYLAARLPSTYGVVCEVLKKLGERADVTSLLDIGAGPGTCLLAAAEMGLPLKKATMVERDPCWIALGKRLTADLTDIEQHWLCQDATMGDLTLHDLVIASYSLNELSEKTCMQLVEKLWELTGQFLILIEPGTKMCFERLNKIRTHLLTLNAHLIAPCPHSKSCPFDWCHFSHRIARSSLHRKTKEATLNYEDEKFSYLIFSKSNRKPCHARVLRHPFKGEGFIKLQLCSADGIVHKTVTKKNKESYAYARKIKWGDDYNIE